MALTASIQFPLGTVAPDFSLLDVVSGKELSLQEVKSDIATIIMFICNHCYYVGHIQEKMSEMAAQYYETGIRFVAISANDVARYPDDSPEQMKQQATEHKFSFPYFYDETQSVAKSFDAVCTPDFYVFDKDLKSIYHGRFDDSRPGMPTPVTGKELQQVLEAVLNHQPIISVQIPSIGCGIKWKK